MSTTETPTRERLLAFRHDLAHVWNEEGAREAFSCARETADRHGIEIWQATVVVWLLAREHGDDEAAASAISSYAAKVALPQHPHRDFSDGERAAFIALMIARDLECQLGGYCTHCVAELLLEEPTPLSVYLGPAAAMEEDPDDA